MSTHIRPATRGDDAATEQIERAADVLLIERFGAVDWPPPTSAQERAGTPGFVLIAETEADAASTFPIGFAHVLEIEGHAHLEQLSVLPTHGRKGVGRRLVLAAVDESRRRGHTQVTLRTYADVPWNAPFYASCGFTESLPASDFHRRLIETEEALQLGTYGRRVQMTISL